MNGINMLRFISNLNPESMTKPIRIIYINPQDGNELVLRIVDHWYVNGQSIVLAAEKIDNPKINTRG